MPVRPHTGSMVRVESAATRRIGSHVFRHAFGPDLLRWIVLLFPLVRGQISHNYRFLFWRVGTERGEMMAFHSRQQVSDTQLNRSTATFVRRHHHIEILHASLSGLGVSIGGAT